MAVTLNASASSGFVTTADTSTILQLQTNGTTAVTVDASANVGIGTTSPTDTSLFSKALDLNGASGAAYYARTNGSSTNYTLFGNYGADGYINNRGAGSLIVYNNNAERMRIDSSGNVGIATTPSAWGGAYKAIDIQYGSIANTQTGSVDVSITQNAYYNGTNWITKYTGASKRYSISDSGHIWYNGASATAGTAITLTQAMTLDTSGNLLVGRTTNTAGTRLNVFGVNAVNAETSTATGACYQGTYSNTTGIVYFGNWSYNGVGVGNINSTGTTTSYVTTSDHRLKENVQPMTGALAKVSQLNPVTYNWKSNGSTGQGFIAHELQEIVPECVSGEKDAVNEEGNPIYQGIDTSFLVATLTAAIKEQQALIQTLTDRITALEGVK